LMNTLGYGPWVRANNSICMRDNRQKYKDDGLKSRTKARLMSYAVVCKANT
jgi:hypothetical protein